MSVRFLLVFSALAVLAGCNQPAEDPASDVEMATPASAAAPAPVAAATAAPTAMPERATLDVAAGNYVADLEHSTLGFRIRHMGMSNYVARFTDYEVKVHYEPDNLAASSVSVTVDPTSIGLDYYGDFEATHPESPYDSFVAELMGDKFFDAERYPTIEFHSTRIERTGSGMFSITGDLSLHGQTHPVTLEASVVGSQSDHPMYGGIDVFGISATGSFQRSAFGMDYLVAPGVLGDEISVHFEGEFNEQKPPAAAASAPAQSPADNVRAPAESEAGNPPPAAPIG